MLGPREATPQFKELCELFLHTRRVFQNYLERGGYLRAEEIQYLATVTLSHIDDMDLGFKWVLRADELPYDELPEVLRPEDVVDWAGEPGGTPMQPLAPDLNKVMALRHAQVVFGSLPRTPKGQISYPGYRSYADIKAPRTPLELRERISELATGVWDAATRKSVDTLDPERSRRVYGFFEAGSWLTSTHVRRMGRH